MARRSHTETFILLRNNASKSRSFYKEFDLDDERVNLVNGKSDDANDIEIANSSDSSSVFPNWISNIEEFRYECNKIQTKIDQLIGIQDEHLKRKASSIFSDESESASDQSYDVEIEFKCQEVNKLFNRLHSLLTQMQSLSESKPNSKIIKNVFQWEVKEVSDLNQKFRSCQRNYLNKCTENNKIDPQFVITFDEEKPSSHQNKSLFSDHIITESEDDLSFFQDFRSAQKSKQLQIPYLDSDTLKARDQEMTSIVKSIVELNQIFHDINTLVINQGSVLDRIDYNIETVQHRVEAGAVELSKAERSIRGARKMKLILMLSGIVILMLLYLVIFKT